MKHITTRAARGALLVLFAGAATLAVPGAADSPRKLWSAKTGGQTAAVVGIHRDVLVVTAGEYVEFGSPNHVLLGLDLATGRALWKVDAGKGRIASAPLLRGGRVIRESGGGPRWAVDALTGKRLPAGSGARTDGEGEESPATGRRFTVQDRELVCLSDDGTVLWRRAFGTKPAAPRVFRGFALVATEGERALHALSLTDGAEAWNVAVPPVPGVKDPEAVNFGFGLEDGILAVANYDGTVTAWAVDGPGAPWTTTLEVDPANLGPAEGGVRVYTADAGVKRAHYDKYALPEAELLKALGGKVPGTSFRLVVRVEGAATAVVKPADPAVQAPVDGFRIETLRCRVLGVPRWE
ncbi:MAG: PQQ-binding-like beta-propeller repeat protein [Acidobacteria bacterium]|nr:PQQ-binding-like beta-propeller repeat protein [Acidobacteriota bacterium]